MPPATKVDRLTRGEGGARRFPRPPRRRPRRAGGLRRCAVSAGAVFHRSQPVAATARRDRHRHGRTAHRLRRCHRPGRHLFDQSDAPAKTIIALTDGNDTKSQVPPIEAARVASERGIRIHTVAIGDPTTVGEEKLDEETLRRVAQRSGGSYFFAGDRAAARGHLRRAGPDRNPAGESHQPPPAARSVLLATARGAAAVDGRQGAGRFCRQSRGTRSDAGAGHGPRRSAHGKSGGAWHERGPRQLPFHPARLAAARAAGRRPVVDVAAPLRSVARLA